MRFNKNSNIARNLPLGLMALAELLLVTVTEAARPSSVLAAPFAADTQDRTHVRGGEVRAQWREGNAIIEVRSNGDIEFTDGDTDVKKVPADGWLVIEEKRGTERLRLNVTPGAGDVPVRSFFVQDEARDFNGEGRAWLAAILPRVVRRTGLGARARIERLHRQSGMGGVLDEITMLVGSTAKRIYFEELIRRGDLDSGTLQSALRQAAREITSSADLQQVLTSFASHAPENKELTRDLILAAGSIESDASKREILALVADQRKLDDATAITLIDSTIGISSNADRSAVLIKMAEVCSSDNAVLASLLKAVQSLESSGEQERVLTAMLKKGEISKEILAQTAALAQNSIESNASKQTVLGIIKRRLTEADKP